VHGRTNLLDDAFIDDGDAIANRIRLFLVVGHKNRRDAKPLLEVAQLAANLHTELRIQIGQRLVQQKYFGFDSDGTGESDALLLPA
jgi:hypothetical protein